VPELLVGAREVDGRVGLVRLAPRTAGPLEKLGRRPVVVSTFGCDASAGETSAGGVSSSPEVVTVTGESA